MTSDGREAGAPHGSARRPGGRSARVRRAVIDAVFDELFRVGYSGLSVTAVAERAGVNKTSVYRRWGDRDALLADALESVVTSPIEPDDTGSLESDLRAYARSIAALLAARTGRIVTALLTTTARTMPAVEAAKEAILSTRRPLSADIVHRAILRGEAPAGTDAFEVIDHLVAPIYFRLLISGDPVDRALADRCAAATAVATRAGSFVADG